LFCSGPERLHLQGRKQIIQGAKLGAFLDCALVPKERRFRVDLVSQVKNAVFGLPWENLLKRVDGCTRNGAFSQKYTGSKGYWENKCAPNRTPINKSYHPGNADPINKSYRARSADPHTSTKHSSLPRKIATWVSRPFRTAVT
jgi:hypothetical protein